MGALRMSTPNIKFGYGALLGALAWANGLTTYPPLVRIPLAVGLLVECYRSNASAPPIPRVKLPRNLRVLPRAGADIRGKSRTIRPTKKTISLGSISIINLARPPPILNGFDS